ncbi:MAG: hypothetical protein ACRCTD_04260 [Beijerinckiaceae bacterium]
MKFFSVRLAGTALLASVIAGCTIESTTFVNDNVTHRRIDIPAQPAPAPAIAGTVDENGDCMAGKGAVSRAAIGIGSTECDIVGAMGKPDDILIGGSSSAAREAQFLYQTPAGKKLYFFTNGKLTRTVGGE